MLGGLAAAGGAPAACGPGWPSCSASQAARRRRPSTGTPAGAAARGSARWRCSVSILALGGGYALGGRRRGTAGGAPAVDQYVREHAAVSVGVPLTGPVLYQLRAGAEPARASRRRPADPGPGGRPASRRPRPRWCDGEPAGPVGSPASTLAVLVTPVLGRSRRRPRPPGRSPGSDPAALALLGCGRPGRDRPRRTAGSKWSGTPTTGPARTRSSTSATWPARARVVVAAPASGNTSRGGVPRRGRTPPDLLVDLLQRTYRLVLAGDRHRRGPAVDRGRGAASRGWGRGAVLAGRRDRAAAAPRPGRPDRADVRDPRRSAGCRWPANPCRTCRRCCPSRGPRRWTPTPSTTGRLTAGRADAGLGDLTPVRRARPCPARAGDVLHLSLLRRAVDGVGVRPARPAGRRRAAGRPPGDGGRAARPGRARAPAPAGVGRRRLRADRRGGRRPATSWPRSSRTCRTPGPSRPAGPGWSAGCPAWSPGSTRSTDRPGPRATRLGPTQPRPAPDDRPSPMTERPDDPYLAPPPPRPVGTAASAAGGTAGVVGAAGRRTRPADRLPSRRPARRSAATTRTSTTPWVARRREAAAPGRRAGDRPRSCSRSSRVWSVGWSAPGGLPRPAR